MLLKYILGVTTHALVALTKARSTNCTPKKDQKGATNQNPVRVHDGVETVGDGDDCTVGELLSDGLLDDAISPEGRREGGGPVCHFSEGHRRAIAVSEPHPLSLPLT